MVDGSRNPRTFAGPARTASGCALVAAEEHADGDVTVRDAVAMGRLAHRPWWQVEPVAGRRRDRRTRRWRASTSYRSPNVCSTRSRAASGSACGSRRRSRSKRRRCSSMNPSSLPRLGRERTPRSTSCAASQPRARQLPSCCTISIWPWPRSIASCSTATARCWPTAPLPTSFARNCCREAAYGAEIAVGAYG